MPTASEVDYYSSSPPSTQSSIDDDEINKRVYPTWSRYRHLLEHKGYHLETYCDVKAFYSMNPGCESIFTALVKQSLERSDDNELCPDPGLPDNLFRGIRICDGLRVVIKAVHICSRELSIIRYLSTPPHSDNPMNHSIPVLDLVEVRADDIGFIVMEEWSSQLIEVTPCSLGLFLAALRQCIEHAVFMHKHHIAHLDISLRNLLTDYQGRYAYIDYELSHQFNGDPNPSIHGYRGTEIPPEVEKGEPADPYKVDVWAMGVLILRACKLTGYFIPELLQLVEPMLVDKPAARPSMAKVLHTFDGLVRSLESTRLQMACPAKC